MGSIPGWLQLLIKLAIQLGSPALLEFIKKYMSKLPSEIVKLIEDLIAALLDPKSSNSVAKKTAMRKLKKTCDGVGCAPKLKK